MENLKPVRPLNTVDRQTLAERVYRSLSDAIVDGSLASGAELNQVALAKELGVSRVPVREALKRLGAEGLVVNRAYQRYAVRFLSRESVEELLELRAELEVFGVSRALRVFDVPPSDQLDELIRSMREAPTPEDWLRIDREFHRMLCGPRSEAAAITESIRNKIQRYLRNPAGSDVRRREAEREHAEIVRAVNDGDFERTAQLIRAHVAATREVIIHEGPAP